MHTALRAFAVLAVLAAPFPANAEIVPEREDCMRPSPGIVAALFDWIGAASGYEVAGVKTDPPAIFFCDEGDVLDYPGGNALVEPGERGVYDYEARVIYLVGPWDPANLRQRSVLLHELVHDVQFANRAWQCPNATEWEAYKLQEAWMAEQGLVAEFDWLQIWFWSKCGQTPHP